VSAGKEEAVGVALAPGSRGFIVLLGALTAITALSIDMSLPAMPTLTAVFAAPTERTQLTLSVFLLGFAASQLVYGPLSDRFGRRPVLLFGLAIYTAGGIACALSPSMEALIAARFLQGLGAAVGRTLGPAIVRDEFQQPRSAQVLSYITVVMTLAPLLAPIAGAHLLVALGWKAIFLTLGLAGAALLAAAALALGETNRRRDPAALRPRALLRNWFRFFSNPVCAGFALVNCCVFAALFSYISNSPFVFIDTFGLSTESYGYLFGSTALAFMAGSLVNGRLVRRLSPYRALELGFALICSGGLLLVTLAALRLFGPLGVILPMTIFVFGMGMVFPNATAAAMEPLPQMAGTASSLIGSSQMLFGSLVGWVVSRLYDRSSLPMAASVALMSATAALIYLALLRRRP
jgi:DHA1 family bicyclomycin/chloramphenicol resistance-like MFS transporter